MELVPSFKSCAWEYDGDVLAAVVDGQAYPLPKDAFIAFMAQSKTEDAHLSAGDFEITGHNIEVNYKVRFVAYVPDYMAKFVMDTLEVDALLAMIRDIDSGVIRSIDDLLD
jgi:hypothetical protein